MVMCLVQFMNGAPQGHALAKNLRELRRNMPHAAIRPLRHSRRNICSDDST